MPPRQIPTGQGRLAGRFGVAPESSAADAAGATVDEDLFKHTPSHTVAKISTITTNVTQTPRF